ncbi:hypothetical protein IGI04_035948 [Brassica rapa subsp. trilocularis]|uniref:Uncharacterized protein n=1 Tax=Brassica rapa subsp. trilocularis TaxID=1813537 RepID=A0ABQ7LG59_BRACM|nr:hypothetical protein IGI04_035948 [Brassica rapa subsp. trilocularis]
MRMLIIISYAWLSNRANIRQGTSSLTPSTRKIYVLRHRSIWRGLHRPILGELLTADNTIHAKVDQPKEPKLTSNTNPTSLLVLGLVYMGSDSLDKSGRMSLNRTWWLKPLRLDS